MRKGPTKIRKIEPDIVYQSITVAKLINYIMKAGKKQVATRQVYRTLESLMKNKEKKDPVVILEEALNNIKPRVEVRPRRIGGAVYQVPTPLRTHRQNSLSLRWLVNSARMRPNSQYHTFSEKLTAEILEAQKNQGPAIAKRLEAEKMAEANRAFSHLRW